MLQSSNIMKIFIKKNSYVFQERVTLIKIDDLQLMLVVVIIIISWHAHANTNKSNCKR